MSPLRPYQRQAIAGTLFALAVQLGLASVVVMASWWVMAESGWPLVAHVPAWLGMGGTGFEPVTPAV